ncbi:MAG: nucleotidyltransferase family protein [Acidimicrobiia bacterium]|nr:nucleotidyltransferase family protein [Acidimicrobiia bacterium]
MITSHSAPALTGIVGVVLAAGRGERFAAADPSAPPKMLASIDGMPMVRRTVATLLAGGVDRCVVVVASDGASAIGAALDGLAVELVVNPDPSRGMFSSVQCGLHATGEHELCVLLPGDMPFIQPLTVTLLIAHAREASRTTAPALEGHAGHPVVLSPMMRAHILAAQAESRLDHELAHESVLLVPVADPGVRRDVDRPRIAECAR